MSKNVKNTTIRQLEKRYNACDEAVELLDILRASTRLLLKKVRRVYPQEHQDEELIGSVKTIEYDLIVIKSELQDLAMELAEENKRVREGQ